MHVLLAPDSFKGSLSASQVCAALAAGVRAADPSAGTRAVPMADGGEGTLDCLLTSWGGERVAVTVPGPLGAPVEAGYGRSSDGRRAVVELAAASGLALVGDRREPLGASTRGTGLLAADALAAGARELVVCLGGSATTDGGTGLLRALGLRLLDRDGRDLPEGGGALVDLDRLDTSALLPAARQARWRLACDVTSPLVGPRGAAAVFGPQKGASEEDVARLDAGLRRFAAVLHRDLGADVADLPGAGAAGGTAGGLVAVLGGTVEPGAQLVADASGLDPALAEADLVLTGEGSLDAQSEHGKVVSVVAARARAAGVPAVALCGQVAGPFPGLHRVGLTAAFGLADGPRQLQELLDHAPSLLTALAEQVVRLHAASRAPA